jgi:hypothetical protein
MAVKKPRFGGAFWFQSNCSSQRLDVGSLFSLWTLGFFERHFLAFLQGLETVALDGGKMCEHIFAAVIWGNEAKTLGVAEPLDCTCCHLILPPGRTKKIQPLKLTAINTIALVEDWAAWFLLPPI